MQTASSGPAGLKGGFYSPKDDPLSKDIASVRADSDGSVRLPSPREAEIARLALVARQPRRAEVRLEQPNRAIRIIVQKLFIFRRAEIASPDNARAVNVSRIVDPLFERVRWPVTNEHEMLSRNPRDLLVDRHASFWIALIDRVPGFEARHRGPDVFRGK